MDIESGKLYTPEQVQAMDDEARKKLTWISREEYRVMLNYKEHERPARLREMRAKTADKKKKARKSQRAARKKNR